MRQELNNLAWSVRTSGIAFSTPQNRPPRPLVAFHQVHMRQLEILPCSFRWQYLSFSLHRTRVTFWLVDFRKARRLPTQKTDEFQEKFTKVSLRVPLVAKHVFYCYQVKDCICIHPRLDRNSFIRIFRHSNSIHIASSSCETSKSVFFTPSTEPQSPLSM